MVSSDVSAKPQKKTGKWLNCLPELLPQQTFSDEFMGS